ncbi:MAG: YitT family protein [Acutalibacteraceae bacterium]
MCVKNQIKRYGLFLIGLFIASLGVAFSAKAGLGTSPVASVPYSVSIVNHALTFGWWLNILSLIQILVQVLLLRRRCKPTEIVIQTVLAFAYGYMTDFSCRLLSRIQPASYAEKFMWMLVGCVVLAFGIWIQYKGGVAMLPGEAMNRAISITTGKSYENVKIFFDVLYIVLAGAICLVFTGKLQGVREGSVIAAVLIGNIIKLYNRLFDYAVKKISPTVQ